MGDYTTISSLITPLISDEKSLRKNNKATIVGAGSVGIACVMSLLNTKLISEICVCDVNEKLAHGEILDLQHGSVFLNNPHLHWGKGYDNTNDSNVIIVTAGARQQEGQSRLELVQKNVEIFRSIVPPLYKKSPKAIFIIVTNPCDILAYVTMKLCNIPPNQIMGSGTNLDSARFRYFISLKANCAPSAISGYIIGEHGDSSVPVWSGVSIGGVKLIDINPKIGEEDDPEHWDEIHKKVINSAMDVIKLKGYTNWAIGFSVGQIVTAILKDSREIMPVSVLLKGSIHGNDKHVFLSLPCVIGSNGIIGIVKQNLNETEQEKLQISANSLYNIQKDLKI